jgi:hypothetical protein
MAKSNDLLREVLELGKEFVLLDADENHETFKQKSGIKLFLNHWFANKRNKADLVRYFDYNVGKKKVLTDNELMEISFSYLNKELLVRGRDNMLTVMIRAYPLPVHYCFFKYLRNAFYEGWLK